MNFLILKRLSLFILLFAGNTGFAFPSTENTEDFEKKGISYDISEDIQDLFFSTLSGENSFDTLRLPSNGAGNFYFQSSYVARKAIRYIEFSRSIDPGLNVSKIIFPFHSFI